MHIEIVRGHAKPSQKGSRTVNSPPLVLGEWPHKDAWIPYAILFNPTHHNDTEMVGRGEPSLKPGEICLRNASSLPTHLWNLPWAHITRIQSREILSCAKEPPLMRLLQTCPSRNHPVLWIVLRPLPMGKRKRRFCFITAQTLLLQFYSQNPCMLNILSGISPLNPKWMFHDVHSAILCFQIFSSSTYLHSLQGKYEIGELNHFAVLKGLDGRLESLLEDWSLCLLFPAPLLSPPPLPHRPHLLATRCLWGRSMPFWFDLLLVNELKCECSRAPYFLS